MNFKVKFVFFINLRYLIIDKIVDNLNDNVVEF